ncbi:MAG: hypothetical protein IJE78_05415 [Bacteroidaceae bacterium]|nr:hypothetical protein [Bacteroidaceae bacterium]
MLIRKGRKVFADEDIQVDEEVVDEAPADDTDVTVDPSATDLLFEAEDVAELVAEVTGEVVEVTADGDEVVFSVGDNDFTVTADGDEEMLEASTKMLRGKRRVMAARRPMARKAGARRPVTASRKAAPARPLRRPTSRRGR